MPSQRITNAVRLEFTPGALVHTNLSGAAFSGDWLWVAGDEACAIDRLRHLRLQQDKHVDIAYELEGSPMPGPDDSERLQDDIGDDLLRLVFTACHPVLSREARGQVLTDLLAKHLP